MTPQETIEEYKKRISDLIDEAEKAIGYKIDTVEIEQPVGHITKEGIIMQRPVYFHINL